MNWPFGLKATAPTNPVWAGTTSVGRVGGPARDPVNLVDSGSNCDPGGSPLGAFMVSLPTIGRGIVSREPSGAVSCVFGTSDDLDSRGLGALWAVPGIGVSATGGVSAIGAPGD